MPDDQDKTYKQAKSALESILHLDELRKRALGHSFHQPDPAWCNSNRAQGIKFAKQELQSTDSQVKFTGCGKYASCSLIPESIRWKTWSEMTDDEQSELQRIQCLRASYHINPVNSETPLDPPERESKRNYNPFGIRTPNELSANLPCPVGGCVIPEVHRDEIAKCVDTSGVTTADFAMEGSRACPFHSIHTDLSLTAHRPNPLRFAQCYVTLPKFREFLEKHRVIVVAPVHRSIEGNTESGDVFWYPFFSGYSYLQLPARAPRDLVESDRTHDEMPDSYLLDSTESLTARWTLTRLNRELHHRTVQRLPIGSVFDGAESGRLTAPWERHERILSVSDGQASSLLLQWVMLRRVIALIQLGTETKLDLTQRVTWTYAHKDDASPFFDQLSDLENSGYNLQEIFGIYRDRNAYLRTATLKEDLCLLGLIDSSGSISDRTVSAIVWLAARYFAAKRNDDPEADGLDAAIGQWIRGASGFMDEFLALLALSEGGGDIRLTADKVGQDNLARLIWLTVLTALPELILTPAVNEATWEGLKQIGISNGDEVKICAKNWLGDSENQEGTPFKSLSRLVPQLHVLVRAWWVAPLRWLFIPLTAVPPPYNRDAKVSSGLIMLVEDSLDSVAYKNSAIDPQSISRDPILQSLQLVLPVLGSIAALESSCLQEQVMWRFLAWETNRDRLAHVSHEIRSIRAELSFMDSQDAKDIGKHLTLLEAMFQAQLAPYRPSGGGVTDECRVNIFKAAEQASKIFNETFWGRKHGHIEYCNALDPESNQTVLITPFEQRYQNEGIEVLETRAQSEIINLILEALMQRVRHTPKNGVKLHIVQKDGGLCGLQIITSTKIGRTWNYPEDDLNDLPKGRGFHNLFSYAVSLGAVEGSISDDLDKMHGRVEIYFTLDK